MERLTSVKELNFRPAGRVFSSPADWREQVVYQLMIDRFNDHGVDPPPYVRGQSKTRENDPEEGKRFQGGTLRGITAKLDYLQALGVTTLWISPPLKNRVGDECSYHGYGAQDFLAVDPRFGTTSDLRELADALHDRGMYLVMDIVVDHAGDVWGYPDDERCEYDAGKTYDFGFWRAGHHDGAAEGQSKREDGASSASGPALGPDDGIWPIELQREAAFLRKGRMRDVGHAKGDELTDGDFIELKCFDFDDGPTLDAIIAVYKHWIAVADVDGYRIDAARHIRPKHLQVFTNAIRDFAVRIGKMNFVQVGELAQGGKETLAFIASNSPLLDREHSAHFPFLDATLDFDLFKMSSRVMAEKERPSTLRRRWDKLLELHRDPALATKYYWNFMENHDLGATNTRRLLAGVSPEHATAAALRSMAFLLFGPGVPVLYYGTEQGFDGDGKTSDSSNPFPEAGPGDQNIRETMFGGRWGGLLSQGASFFDTKHPIYEGIRRLIDIRREIPALRFGRSLYRESGPGLVAMGRLLDNQDLTVAINVMDLPWKGFVEAPAHGALQLHLANRSVERTHQGVWLELPPFGYEIVINDR